MIVPPQSSAIETEAETVAARAQFELLQDELSSRSSTVHFAQTGVSMVAAVIFAGASGKLFWDAHSRIGMAEGLAAGLVSLSLVVYAVFHYLRGKRVLAHELNRFELFQALRRRLGLDDPSVLLPQ